MLLGAAAAAVGGGFGCTSTPIDVATLPPAVLANGLLAHWKFDDAVGASVEDSSGNGRDGLIFGPNWSWTEGRFGGALRFGGTDQVSVGLFPQATSRFSVSAWLRIETGSLGPPIAALLSNEQLGGLGTIAGGWSLNVALMPLDSNYHFGYWTAPPTSDFSYSECECVVAEQWMHIAAVVDTPAATLTLYVNGLPRSEVPIVGGITRGSGTLFMGRWPEQGRLLNGALDEVAIYGRALVPEEVAFLATAPASDPQ
jgi:hypothetical protein